MYIFYDPLCAKSAIQVAACLRLCYILSKLVDTPPVISSMRIQKDNPSNNKHWCITFITAQRECRSSSYLPPPPIARIDVSMPVGWVRVVNNVGKLNLRARDTTSCAAAAAAATSSMRKGVRVENRFRSKLRAAAVGRSVVQYLSTPRKSIRACVHNSN